MCRSSNQCDNLCETAKCYFPFRIKKKCKGSVNRGGLRIGAFTFTWASNGSQAPGTQQRPLCLWTRAGPPPSPPPTPTPPPLVTLRRMKPLSGARGNAFCTGSIADFHPITPRSSSQVPLRTDPAITRLSFHWSYSSSPSSSSSSSSSTTTSFSSYFSYLALQTNSSTSFLWLQQLGDVINQSFQWFEIFHRK